MQNLIVSAATTQEDDMANTRNWVELFLFSFLSLIALLFAAFIEFVLPVFVPTYAYLAFGVFCLTLLLPFLRDNRLKVKYAVQVFLLSA
jgi:hypothetical protein